MHATIGMILLGMAAALPPARADAPADELAKFQGLWRMVSAEADGQAIDPEMASKFTVEIRGDRHTVRYGVQVLEKDVQFTLDPTKTPREVTDIVTEGPNKGTVIAGIYKLDGETLTSCTGRDGQRPTEFSAPAGSKRTLRVFRREPQGDEAVAKDLALFEGTWRIETAEVDGEELPAEVARGMRLVLKGDKFTLKTGDGQASGTFKIDPTKVPKTIDVTTTDGPQKGQTMKGIYEIQDGTYKVCLAPEGQPRPSEFASEKGSGTVLEVLKKETP